MKLIKFLSLSLCSTTFFLLGCASGGVAANPDPFEMTNRRINVFNEGLDEKIVRPIASTYKDYSPEIVQQGIGNFFGNLKDIWSFVNNGLQLKPKETLETGARVLVNSTVGIYGLFDFATPMGVQRHSADFGQTLGYWGTPAGPYLVLPLLGPSTVRDTAALLVDRQGDLLNSVHPIVTRNQGTVLRAVDKRASYIGMDDRLSEMALDKYTFVRDAYLQRRAAQVRRGPPPEDDSPDGSQ